MAATRDMSRLWERLQTDRRAGIAYWLFACAIFLLYPAISEIAGGVTWSSTFIRRDTLQYSATCGWIVLLIFALRYVPVAFWILSVTSIAAALRLNYSALAATWGRVVMWSTGLAALLLVIGFVLMTTAWLNDRRSSSGSRGL